jgi:predicted ATP-grasp superfamily ATP-dependent carboligase
MSTWRAALPVMVVDAQALGSLAVIRSLGRAGYPVVAVAPSASGIGLHSRYAARSLVAPPYTDPGFLQWLRQAIAQEGIRAIVPSEGFLHAVRPAFAELRAFLPVSGDAAKVYAGLSKYELFHRLQATSITAHIPRLAFVGEGFPLPSPSALEALGYPLFAKFDAQNGRSGEEANVVERLPDYGSFSARLPRLLARFHRGVVQGYCPGIGVGAFFLRWNGRILAHFMHRRIHEVPHTGGASSFRRAWMHEAILEHARALLEQLDWQGVAMLEYRWDPASDRFWLMELNARFWGSLHLALFAGVDFPRLLMDAFFERPELCPAFRRDVSSRLTFPKEIEYVRSCLKDRALPLWRRAWPVAEFLLLGLNPLVRSDLLYPGDRGLYVRMMRQSLQKFLA